MSGIAGHADLKSKVGQLGMKALIYSELVTTAALSTAWRPSTSARPE